MLKTAVIALIILTLSISTWVDATRCSIKPRSPSNRFLLVTEFQASWWTAFYHCRKLGMQLAHISSQQDQDELTDLVHKMGVQSNIWLSANNMANPEVFEWAATGERLRYTNWATEEPKMTQNRSCVHARNLSAVGQNMVWLTTPCPTLNSFVCEKDSI